METNEYARVLSTFYGKSLILEDTSEFHPVLKFWFMDALAHLDYSISILSFSPDSPKNLMTREYIKYHTDEGKTGDLAVFPGFMKWLSEKDTELYERFPLFIQKIYDPCDHASYRSFIIVLNPEEKRPIPPETLRIMVDEMFENSYLSILYKGSKVSQLLDTYLKLL